jgi:hypothetical protein
MESDFEGGGGVCVAKFLLFLGGGGTWREGFHCTVEI